MFCKRGRIAVLGATGACSLTIHIEVTAGHEVERSTGHSTGLGSSWVMSWVTAAVDRMPCSRVGR